MAKCMGFQILLKGYKSNGGYELGNYPLSTSSSPILKGLLGLAAMRAARIPKTTIFAILDAAFCTIEDLLTADLSHDHLCDRLETLGIGCNVVFDRL